MLHEICHFQPELIKYWGYPVEEHFVTTEDGYILGMHRIPYGKGGPSANSSRIPAFLAHGLESSSSQWVFGPPEKSLGFILADAGKYLKQQLFKITFLKISFQRARIIFP